ncbi:DUF339-domain-containing protein [Nadsonia fulvescens var. elongata DSM 6958]|uniref:Succinate dehydrogenase assembly factor 2, mitochondrial n=1 Tax=Nadsonia fulvescens var. elongata DSM 6958 TaxID=857566 RepID=A0A1E3PEB9_9ASCO|nr:DUF339-domain-containing protein [Nadsonia fulvescens var. elongata DSM 6958]
MLNSQIVRRVAGLSGRIATVPRTALLRTFADKASRAPEDTALNHEVKVKFTIEPIPRPNEPTENKRARLLYQSRKRGILETDLLLSKYADLYLKDMTREELEEYDELLDNPDWDIFYWATRNEDVKVCPERWESSKTMEKLRDLAENRNRHTLRMPDLKF